MVKRLCSTLLTLVLLVVLVGVANAKWINIETTTRTCGKIVVAVPDWTLERGWVSEIDPTCSTAELFFEKGKSHETSSWTLLIMNCKPVLLVVRHGDPKYYVYTEKTGIQETIQELAEAWVLVMLLK